MIYENGAKKNISLERKKDSKWLTQKKLRFSKLPILEIFLPKFHELVLGIVVLNDAKDIDAAQPIWS